MMDHDQFDAVVLAVVERLGADVAGLAICEEVERDLLSSGDIKHQLARAAVFASLGRLEGRGLIKSWIGGEDEGPSKRHYEVIGGGE